MYGKSQLANLVTQTVFLNLLDSPLKKINHLYNANYSTRVISDQAVFFLTVTATGTTKTL